MTQLPPPGVIGGGGGTPSSPPPPPPPPSTSFSAGITFIGGESGDLNQSFVLSGIEQQNWSLITVFGQTYILFTQGIWNTLWQLIPNGDLTTAFIAAGSGHHAVGINVNFLSPSPGLGDAGVSVLFDTGISPRAWRAIPVTNNVGTPWTFVPGTGLPAGDGLDMAGGIDYGQDAMVVFTGPASRFAEDGVTFGVNGVPPSQVNGIFYEWGHSGVYIGAANGGVVKTIDKGANWGYVRPHAGIGTLWPAGAVGRDITFLGLNPPAEVPDLYVIGTTDYKRLQPSESGPVWEDKDGAPPATTSYLLRYYGAGKMAHLDSNFTTFRISTDTGEIWTSRAAPIGRFLQAYDIAGSGRVWAFILNTTPAPDQGEIYYSDDNGQNWTLSLAGFNLTDPAFIAVNPSNSNQIAGIYKSVTGNVKIVVSQNGGSSWVHNDVHTGTQQVGKASGILVWVGNRIVTAFDLDDGRIIITYSDDFGATWTVSFDEDQGAATARVLEMISGGVFGPIFVAIDRNPNPILRSPSGEVWDSLSGN